MLKKRKATIAIILIIILVISFIGIRKIDSRRAALNEIEDDLGIPTSIMEVTIGELRDELSYIGTLESENSVIISPKTTSQVNKLNFREGDFVSKGNVIANLDDSQVSAKKNTTMQRKESLNINNSYLSKEIDDYHSANPINKKIKALENNYEFLSGQVEKQKILYESGAIPKNSYDEAVHEQEVLAIQIEELKASSNNAYNKLVHEKNLVGAQMGELDALASELNLSIQDTVIRAPINGRIREIKHSEGDLAIMGQPLVIIDDLEKLIVKVNVGQDDMVKLKLGTRAIIEDDFNSKEIEGEITNIMTAINPRTKLGEVEVSFLLDDKKNLLLGTSKKVSFILNDQIKKEVLIENAYIKELKDKKIVYVEKNGYVYEKEIETGLNVGDKVEVLKGLKKGDKLAYKNIKSLYDGAKIFIYQGVDSL